ncbi:MAG: ABC transporter ATP-binding protein/permease [Butyrivibrio sp.]|nr:ABC transporter ATP-binding protein/permease [Butyrivibrio sp.]
MRSKKSKAGSNPLHTEYGVLSNSFYILKKLRQYTPSLIWIMLVGMLAGSAVQLMWSFIGKFIIDLVQAQALTPEKDISPLLSMLAVTSGIELAALTLNAVTNNRTWFRFIHARQKLITERIKKVLTMSYEQLEKPDVLDMSEKANQATGGNDNGVEGMMRTVYDFGSRLVLLAATVSAVMALDWRLIIILVAVGVVQYIFFRHIVKRDKKETWDALAPVWRKTYYMGQVTQSFDYAKDIRLFNMKGWLLKKQHGINMQKQERMLHSRNLWIINSVFAHFMAIISRGAVYAILIAAVIGRDMSIGNFTLFLGLASTFSETLMQFLNMLVDLRKHSLETDDFRSFIDLPTEETGDFLPVPRSGEYVFEFKNVSYKYHGADSFALKGLNLTLNSGERLAVVGLNGAGKTTFIKLLLRLYDATEGQILLNGTDIRRFRRGEYYALFAPVFQNVEIFAFPLGENISMKSAEQTDYCRSEQCAREAGLGDKLDSLANGIRTEMLKVIDEHGVDFSGGERQKLALARALYKDAPVIVLDEPTAALDALAEYDLYKNFDEIIKNKSAVYISHRLSSTRFCDRIAMFKSGEMVEYGSHEELMHKGGEYAEIFEIQAQYYKEGMDYAEAAN